MSDVTATVERACRALAELEPQPFHLPIGALAPVVAGAVAGLERADWWVPGLRERTGAVLRDVPVERLVDGTRGARPYKVAPPSPSPALRALYAVGLALGSGRCALAHLGIGSVSDGAFTEALNLGALYRAPVIFVVAVHPLSGGAPLGHQSAASPADLARAYGWDVHAIDASAPHAITQAVRAARASGEPTLLVADLPAPA